MLDKTKIDEDAAAPSAISTSTLSNANHSILNGILGPENFQSASKVSGISKRLVFSPSGTKTIIEKVKNKALNKKDKRNG